MASAAITWIHLSDFHAGQKGEAVWHQVDTELERSVKEMAARLGVPDLVLFTGDLANWGLEKEYEQVDALLDRINKWVGRDLPVVAVPGNHDLKRPKNTWRYAALKGYEQEAGLREALWSSEERLLDPLFPHYKQWSDRRMLPSLDQWTPHVSPRVPGDLSVVVDKNGLRLGLVGLNTAWTHLSDEAERHGLQLPVEQLMAALPSDSGNPLDWFKDVDASFLLTHHPYRWLTKKAQSTYLAEIHTPNRFALALFGHMHQAQSQVISVSGTHPRAYFQAPSLFGLEHYGEHDEDRAMGYAWGRFSNTGEVRVWPQERVQRGGGSFAFDRDQRFEPADDGLGGFVLVEGKVTKSASSTDSEAAKDAAVADSASSKQPAFVDPVPVQDLRQYLKMAESLHREVQMVGFSTSVRATVRLDDLYVPLHAVLDRAGGGRKAHSKAEHTETLHKREGLEHCEDLRLADAFRRAQQMGKRGLVLLGDPGSGKTTHLKQVLLKIVREGAESIGLPKDTVPVFLPLRNLKDRSQGFPGFIQQELDNPMLNVADDFGTQMCKRGRLLYLLDGLDEVANAEERAKVARWIEKARLAGHDSYFLVSSRYAGYTEDIQFKAEFIELHLRPMDEKQMRTFVTRWYDIIEHEALADPVQAKIRAEQRSGELLEVLTDRKFTAVARVYELSRNPLLLTAICLVHRDRGRLPRARGQLYDESIGVLLERWRTRPSESLHPSEALQVLQPVAHWMHSVDNRARASAEELEGPVTQALSTLRHVQMTAPLFLKSVRDDSGLLTGWGVNEYGFMHLGFQEYLTAQRLRYAGLKDPKVFEELAGRFDHSWWKEVILLMLALPNPCVFEEFMRAVVRQLEFPGWANSGQMQLCLAEAAEVSAVPFLEVMQKPEEFSVEHQMAAAMLLANTMSDEAKETAVPLIEQAHASVRDLWSSLTGHAAQGLDVVVHEPSGLEMVRIPAGSFLIGSPVNEEERDDDEQQHEVVLSEFRLARTPVTNAHYRRYMEAASVVQEPRYWGDRSYNQDDQPVVGVSWNEAQAYCKWAGLRLPTEAQWEYACRAGTTTRYHSGDREADLARVGWYYKNSDGRLHSAGELEPNDWGLFDMHGNVREWCMDVLSSYETRARDGDGLRHQPVGDADRVVRGGDFGGLVRGARSSYRGSLSPDARYRNVGFRPAQGID